ncbi:hypothetical protein [Hahella sp. HN01]|uniref:hypothetical protein n=1 Tax=Hahella sp. HN01 TaxID=2847262 RepID=UPI001C1EEA91|nr:hypothetical protein [Hahella sp. HN01]MBU6955751.1 hypothetical protein [Hahella sp. HN01]
MEENQIPRRHWHLDKTISVGHLISTLVIAISVITWAGSIDRRVEQNALAVKYLNEEQVQQRQRIDAVRNEIKTDLRAINDKLDRLIERQSER